MLSHNEKRNSAHSVTVNVSRPRTFAKHPVSDLKYKTSKKKMFDKVITKPSDATIHIYSIPDCKPLKVNAFKGDVSLLPYRLFAEKQETHTQKLRRAIKLQDKYKIINTDLRNRLHIEIPPNDIETVTDIDDRYFRYLDGNNRQTHIPKFKSLKFEFHKRLRLRQEIGYRQDCILNIEQTYRREQLKYERSVQRYMDQVKQLNEFVAKDYERSMASLKKCEALTAELDAQITQREILANKQFTIQSSLIGLDYLYLVQQKYGRFLYYLSPPSWRSKHREFAHSVEIEAKGFDLGSSNEEDTFNVILQNMHNECCIGLVKPVLYFSRPDVLMNMFERIEKQHLNHFTHVVSLGPRAAILNKVVVYLKTSIERDTALVAHLIDDFLQHVNFCEEREAQLRAKFMKILNGLFYDTVAATDVLKLKMHLEFYYQELYGDEPFNMSSVLMAKALETMYTDYSFRLDAFTNDKVKMALKRCIQNEAKKIRKAYAAARELRLFDRLEHSLLRAYEKRIPNVMLTADNQKKSSGRKKRLHSVKPSVNKRVSSQQYSLTEAELEYLHLFTDWTNNEDPAKYLHSLSISGRINSNNK